MDGLLINWLNNGRRRNCRHFAEYSGRFGFLRLKSGTYVRSQCLQALEPNRKLKMAGTTEEKPEPVGRSIFLDVRICEILKHLFCRAFNVLKKGLFVLGFPESRQNRWVPSLPSDVTKSLTHKKFRQTTAWLQANLDKYKISQVVSVPVQAPNFSWAEPSSN